MKKLFCLLMLFAMMSCTSEKPSVTSEGQGAGGPQAGAAATQEGAGEVMYALELVAPNPTRNVYLTVVPKGFNTTEAQIIWLVNDVSVPSPVPHMFNTKETKRGDTVQARATVRGREVVSNSVIIRNTPPVVAKIRILPEVFKPGDSLSVEVAGSDPDGDDVTFQYEWTKNGEPAGNSKMIEVPIKKGDRVSVKVTPFDGEDYGPAYMMNTQLANLPPRIIDHKEHDFDGRIFTYQVKAADPDGDPLTYSLRTAPPGVSIDPASGLISWQVPEDKRGKVSFAVSVQDGKGGEATYVLNLESTGEEEL